MVDFNSNEPKSTHRRLFLFLIMLFVKFKIVGFMNRKNIQEETYSKLVSTAVTLVKKQGFENIRADYEEYEKPAALSQQGSNTVYTPDITAYGKQQGKCYFEIVSKDAKNKDELISKWKLLSRLAQIKNGTFFLLAPRGTMRYANQIVDQYNIHADILKLQSA